MILLEAENAAFIHIPKTAGQSVAAGLGVTEHRAVHNLKGANRLGDRFVFTIVRHPVTRFVSAFRYSRRRAAKADAAGGHPIRSLIAANKIKTAENLALALSELGDDAELMVHKDVHFRPQVTWLHATHPSFIGRYERLDLDFARLLKFLGRDPVALPEINRSKGKQPALSAKALETIAKLYADDMNALGYRLPKPAKPRRAGAAVRAQEQTPA